MSKCLIILSVNWCFISEVHGDNEACTEGLEPGLCHLPPSQDGFSARRIEPAGPPSPSIHCHPHSGHQRCEGRSAFHHCPGRCLKKAGVGLVPPAVPLLVGSTMACAVNNLGGSHPALIPARRWHSLGGGPAPRGWCCGSPGGKIISRVKINGLLLFTYALSHTVCFNPDPFSQISQNGSSY